MSILKDNEWKFINDMLLELYYVEDLGEFGYTFLTSIRALIPYVQSNFRIIEPRAGEELREFAVFIDTDESKIATFYANIVPEKDYLKNFYNYRQSVVYVDSDLLPKEIRENTDFYRDFLEPQGIPNVCGIIILKSGKLMGIFNLFRGKDWGDFTEKEVFILDVFKNHLTGILDKLLQNRQVSIYNNSIEESMKRYNLTKREKEILGYVIAGYSNDEIIEKLYISVSTLKKHIHNIFVKLHVKNRIEIMKLFNLGASRAPCKWVDS